MKGIGCDIIEIDRVAQVIERHGNTFLNRTFTQQEQAYCLKRAGSERHFAARFAAKEAISKALGCGIGKHLSFLDIEIINNEAGKPEVILSEKAALFHNHPKILLTISHAKAYATAFAICI